MSQFIEMIAKSYEENSLGDFVERITPAKCADKELPILSITKENGLVLQSERFDCIVASEDKSNYIIVPRGYLVQGIHIDESNWGIQNIVDEGIVSPAYKLWRFKDKFIIPDLLVYYLRSTMAISYFKSKFIGSTVPRRQVIRKEDLLDMPLNFPLKEGQEEFYKFFEQADKSKFADFKSQFIEMFGNPFLNDKNWERYETLESATQIVLGSTPDTKNPSYWDGEYRWITPAEMDDNTFIVNDTVRHITQEGINKAHLTLMPEGSVLLSTRAPIGKIGIVGKEMCCNQGFKNFICGDDIDSIFLYYTLKLNKVTLCSMGTGTTFKELSRKSVASIKVSIPPIQLQKQFGDIYLQADKSKSVYQKICRTTLCS